MSSREAPNTVKDLADFWFAGEKLNINQHRWPVRRTLRASCRACGDGVVVGMAKKMFGMAKKTDAPESSAALGSICAALLPIYVIFVPFGTGDPGSDIKLKPGARS